MATKIVTPVSLKKPKIKKDSIHYTLKFFFVLLQFTGFLPVQGILFSPRDLQFKWLSLPFLYSFYIFLSSCVLCVLQVYHYFSEGLNLTTENDVIYVITAVISLIFFFQLARQWPGLIKKWCHLDEKFNSIYGYPKFAILKSSLIVAFYMILILGEYFSFIYFKCDPNSDSDVNFQQMMEKMYFYIFSYIPYNVYVVIALALPSFSAFAALSLIDIFLILISFSVAFRFYQINEKLEQHKKKNSSINFWMTLRKNYSEMGNLCSEINSKIANIIILSYGSNMLILLIQLRTFISDEVQGEIVIFYCYVFSSLLIRLLGVYYFSSRINAESRRPIRILFAVSTGTYNVEIRRWYMQMKLDSVALSGKTLFKITPGLILSIAGAVVTYELIFIQFSQPKQ